MRINYDVDGIEQALAQDVTIDEISEVLRSRPQLHPDLDEDVRSVAGRTATGRLVVVWLEEQTDDSWDLITAFEAGFATQLKWNHAFGGRS